MFRHSHGRQAQGGVAGLFSPLASVASIGLAVFIAPSIWPLFEGGIMARLYGLYGYEAANWLGWALHILTYPLTYFAIRIGIMAVLTALSAFATNRLI